MSLTKSDRERVVKQAQEKGHTWSSDRSTMIDRNGSKVKFSESGGSVDINGTRYNTSSGAGKSKRW